MPLPKIDQPIFNITLPSTETVIRYRPFTVKEEKILLIARESKDLDQTITAIKQIINNCVQDELDVDKLAMFDLEYLLINIRAKSVNNTVEFTIKDPETEENIDLEIDINDITIKKDENHSKVIPIDGTYFLTMRYPTIEQLKILSTATGENKNEIRFQVMIDCIESVASEDEVFELSDFTETEVNEFLESLSSKNVGKMKEFFDTMPTLRYEKEYKRSDGEVKTFVAQGTETFFI